MSKRIAAAFAVAFFVFVPSIISNIDGIPQINPRERQCLYEALWHEARGESIEGIKAVLSVIQNRVYSNKYPGSYCKVINQHKQFSYVHQFRSKGKSTLPKPSDATVELSIEIQRLVEDALHGRFNPTLDSRVLWYHTKEVNPRWNRKLKLVKIVGNHKFFAER